ncbi:hypothetical protein M433DRAFT_148852 [Acidomyces richmondensis BFW]|nr:MAG: hypothetical protein FE78DRAFT_84005 [Acidomyces sp. 'richmondensis']KYG50418.1 hypothetical protein M433DRAFT_148852 [Acidomyces richmondensis BFW]
MSSTVYVVDSSARRTPIKVTPAKYLREILEEACKSKKLNPDEYMLKTQNNKVLDLSQQFRLSGLTAGAKLQLTQASRSPSVVSVALQLPESEGAGRLVDKFPSNTSLWLVLRKFEEGVAGGSQKLNLTQRGAPSSGSGAGRLMYEQPVLNVGGRTVDAFTDLQKTLAQLGFNGGNVGIRIGFKNSGQPLEDAMQEISRYFVSLDQASESSGASDRQAAQNARVDAPNGERLDSVENSASKTREAEIRVGENLNEDGALERVPTAATPADNNTPGSSSDKVSDSSQAPHMIHGVTVYRAPSNSTPAAALQPDDEELYEPTLDHAKAHQAALQRAGKNQRLLSDKELEEQEEARQQKTANVQQVVVRIRYPDQSLIEITVPASETSEDLYAKVTRTLEADTEPFELRYFGEKGPQTLPRSSIQRLVRDFGFRGKVLVTIAWTPDASLKARRGPSLKAEYLANATDLKVELADQQGRGMERHDDAMAKQKPPEKKENPAKGDMEARLKKLIGFGKK